MEMFDEPAGLYFYHLKQSYLGVFDYRYLTRADLTFHCYSVHYTWTKRPSPVYLSKSTVVLLYDEV